MAIENPNSSETESATQVEQRMVPINVAGGVIQIRPIEDEDRDAVVAISLQYRSFSATLELENEEATQVATRLLEIAQEDS